MGGARVFLRNNSLFDQTLELRRRHSKSTPDNLRRMRSQTRRSVAVSDGRSGKLDRVADHPGRCPALRQVLFDDDCTCDDLWIGKYLVHFIDRAGWNEFGIEGSKQVKFPEGPDFGAQGLYELTPISDPVGILLEAQVLRELGNAEDRGKTRKLIIVAHRNDDVPVQHGKRLIRYDVGMGVAVPLWRFA